MCVCVSGMVGGQSDNYIQLDLARINYCQSDFC